MVDIKNLITVYPTTPIDKIQDALKETHCTIKFTPGKYNITKVLLIYSNTNILLDNAILVRKNPKQIFTNYLNPNKEYHYNATENVNIYGNGTLLGNGSTKICSDISLMHCNGFTIEGISFEKTYKSHALDLAGCSNITLNNVKFKDRIINPNALLKEEINIDYSYYGGFPYYTKGSKCYNYNHCKDITFNGCEFINVNVCIGNHYDNTKLRHKNITISKCTANGTVINDVGYFVNLSNVDRLTIEKNIVKNFSQGVIIYTLYNLGCNNINIYENMFSGAKGNKDITGIWIKGDNGVFHDKVIITKNKFALNNTKAKYDIIVSNTKDVTVKNNDTKLEVKIDKDS